MNKQKWQVKMMVILFGLFIFGGCIPLPSQTGIGTSKRDENTGSLSKQYPKSMDETCKAAIAACGDMKLNITKQQLGSHESLLEAVEPAAFAKAEYKVKVELSSQADQSTTVNVKVGGPPTPIGAMFGEGEYLQDREKEFHQHMMDHLNIPKEMETIDYISII